MHDHTTLPSGTAAARPKLTDILNGGASTLRDAWADAHAATDFTPLPAGTYTARIIGGELTTAKTGTPGYKLTFRVLEGEHQGRQVWHDIWLTAAALPMAKRDLGKLGVTALEQLESPLPQGIRCSVKLALRKADDATTYNRVRGFDVLGIDHDPTADPDFAPASGAAAALVHFAAGLAPRSSAREAAAAASGGANPSGLTSAAAAAAGAAGVNPSAQHTIAAATLIDTTPPTRSALEAGR